MDGLQLALTVIRMAAGFAINGDNFAFRPCG